MADRIGSESKEKSLYLIQIHYLEEQLERCQLKHEELENQTKELASQYSELEEHKKDTTEVLKRTLAAKEREVEELAEQLESEQRAAKQDREELKLQHSLQMKELQERFDELNSKRVMLVAKLQEQQELEEWLQRPLMSDIEFLRKQLDCREEKHLAAIDSLQKEAESEWEKMIVDRQSTVDKAVQSKTSQILREERAHHDERLEQLSFLLKENLTLLKEKNVLRDKVRDLCFERDRLREDLKEIRLESFTCKKEVKQRTTEWQQLKAELKVELKDRSIAHKSILAEKETLSQQLASVSEESRQKAAEAVQLRSELQMESSRRRKLEGVMQKTVIILRHILTDLEEASEASEASEAEWKTLRLLEILENSTTPTPLGDQTPPSMTHLRRAVED